MLGGGGGSWDGGDGVGARAFGQADRFVLFRFVFVSFCLYFIIIDYPCRSPAVRLRLRPVLPIHSIHSKIAEIHL